MSVSKWRWTEACDGRPCPGDCDYCDWNLEDEENECSVLSDDGNDVILCASEGMEE